MQNASISCSYNTHPC